nr:hypothetical protein [Tanacetum cinerariifolium]
MATTTSPAESPCHHHLHHGLLNTINTVTPPPYHKSIITRPPPPAVTNNKGAFGVARNTTKGCIWVNGKTTGEHAQGVFCIIKRRQGACGLINTTRAYLFLVNNLDLG